MKILGWIHVVLGLLAIGSGAIVLRGVLRVALSGHRVVRFLRYSLIASVGRPPASNPSPLADPGNLHAIGLLFGSRRSCMA